MKVERAAAFPRGATRGAAIFCCLTAAVVPCIGSGAEFFLKGAMLPNTGGFVFWVFVFGLLARGVPSIGFLVTREKRRCGFTREPELFSFATNPPFMRAVYMGFSCTSTYPHYFQVLRCEVRCQP